MLRRQFNFFRQFDCALWILTIGWFVGALGFAASIPFVSIYFYKQLGMSTTQIGIYFGVLAIVRSVFQLVGGEMSDRVGRRSLLIHSQTIRACLGMYFFFGSCFRYRILLVWSASA